MNEDTEGNPKDHSLGLTRGLSSEEPMHVALAANQGYFPGFACAIFSIASASSGAISFHVMDGGIDDLSWNLVEQKLTSLGTTFCLQRHRISLGAFDGFPPDYGGGVMTYARLLMQSLIKEDEVIYVDSDILCLRDLRVLWREPLGDNLIAACQDWSIKVLANDSVRHLNDAEAREWYFNAGLMKVNLRMWRQESVQSKSLAFLKDFGAKCTWGDQTALNAICRGKVKYLDRGWNRSSFDAFTLRDFTESRINIHYISKAKPWQMYDCRTVSNIVWRLYCEKWVPGLGIRRSWSGQVRKRCYDLAVFVLNGCGDALIGTIEVVRSCLGRPSSNMRFQVLSHWLEQRRVGIEIVKWAWRTTASRRNVQGKAEHSEQVVFAVR
jgi:lipopolysaccharide biosynthesis glycosyltransferase